MIRTVIAVSYAFLNVELYICRLTGKTSLHSGVSGDINDSNIPCYKKKIL